MIRKYYWVYRATQYMYSQVKFYGWTKRECWGYCKELYCTYEGWQYEPEDAVSEDMSYWEE